MNRWSQLMVLAVVVGMVFLVRVAITCSQIGPLREMHMVEVLSKDAERVYTVSIPAAFNKDIMHDQVVTIRLCARGDDLPLIPGMVMEPFQYHQQLDCLLIDGSTNVDWLRDSHRNVIDKHGKQLFSGGKS